MQPYHYGLDLSIDDPSSMNLVTLHHECAKLLGSRHRQSKPRPSALHPPSPRRSDQHHFVRVMCMRADYEVSQNTSETEISTQGRSIGGNTHQPKEKLITIRRGERGWAGRCGPLWSPTSCPPGTHLGGRRSPPHPRATIKALPTAPHRPRPYGLSGLLPDFRTWKLSANAS